MAKEKKPRKISERSKCLKETIAKALIEPIPLDELKNIKTYQDALKTWGKKFGKISTECRSKFPKK